MSADPSSFTLFPNLPPELRTQPGDEGYLPELEDNINIDFRPDLVIQIPVDLPLILVNREARRVVLEWAREYGIKMPPVGDSHTCMRPFDPHRDVIYVEINKMMEFERAPWERMFEPDLAGRFISSGTRPKCLAISEMAFRDDQVKPNILSMHNYASHLFVIVGEQPDFEGLWEVDSSRGRSVFWNWEKLCFEMGDGDFITDEGLYRIIEEGEKQLSEDLDDFADLEIRPAFAVRR
ncbi:hypothetical protein N0V84_009705 [Fusarium piperis]|uniref:Uncharacterized protein n=1 Tax=Fusarium piperis TaxID=1435070 RepID=A0A9W9BI71_9HYPO|nr:hypothetical protein N0V84_009705 [Fusarium piperis]